MINYERTHWYGLSYLFAWRGILLPRLLPVILVSGVISMLVATEIAGDVCESETAQQLFEHPYAFQLFGIVSSATCRSLG